MAAPLSYPGVYIQEVPGGVRTIAGVATSVTALIGRALRGPVNDPVAINDFGDFERVFGGLGVDYPMSYAVRDFFANGGVQAVVVRLHKPAGAGTPDAARISAEGLSLEAASPGSWANALRVRVDHDVASDLPFLTAFGLSRSDLFNLTVRDTSTGATETFRNLTVAESPRRVDRVLKQESGFVRVSGNLPESIPGANATPGPADDLWDDDTLSSPVLIKAGDGSALDQVAYEGSRDQETGLFALEKADLFNLLCIPPDTRDGNVPTALWSIAMTYCQERRAMLIVDPPSDWNDVDKATSGLSGLSLTGLAARNAALYFPRVQEVDPLLERLDTFVPCGIVAGVIARTDATRGIWKAPAGTEAALHGVQGLDVELTGGEIGRLNLLGINSLRSLPAVGHVAWGARTLRGADPLADEYKYIPVRRLALFIEESIWRGTQWVVFEPNDEPLWAHIRLNVGAFLHGLFRQGAFQGSSPRAAYFVKVDAETTTQNDRNRGVVNVVVGFAPLKPAEFVVVKIQQAAGQIEP